jgi:hypothetical protein
MTRAWVLALLVLVLAACGGATTPSRSGPAAGRPAKSALINLHSTAQLRSIFNSASGEPRLVVLLSPT